MGILVRPVSLIRVPRWGQWKLVLSLYDGRECPDCGSVCIGKKARQVHRQWHIDRTDFDSRAVDALRRLVVEAGLNPVDLAEPEGRYEADDLDERLTAKVRAVVGGGYDDEEDDDE